jgi:hypothetical protein
MAPESLRPAADGVAVITIAATRSDNAVATTGWAMDQ